MKNLLFLILTLFSCEYQNDLIHIKPELMTMKIAISGVASVGCVVFDGDSNTARLWMSSYFTNGWDVATGGAGTIEVLDRIPMVASVQPSIVVLMVGTNDLGSIYNPGSNQHSGYIDETLQDFFDRYQQIVDSYKLSSAKKIICVSVLPQTQGFLVPDASINDFINLANKKLKILVESSGCIFIDEWSDFYDAENNRIKEEYDADGLHINTNGGNLHMENIIAVF